MRKQIPAKTQQMEVEEVRPNSKRGTPVIEIEHGVIRIKGYKKPTTQTPN